MSARISRARLCAAFLVAFFSSATFAQVSQVADRATLAGDDFIDWQVHSGGADPAELASPAGIITDGGMAVTVAQTWPASYVGTDMGFPTNMPAGDFVYYPWHAEPDFYIYANPISFTDFDGVGVCGFGTQIAPYEAGEFTARIEAFYDTGSALFDVVANSSDADAAFLGVESTDPMTRVDVSIQGTAGGAGFYPSLYVINQVDLKACVDEPEVPVMYCEGFAAPMDRFPVKVKGKGKRVFPLRMNLFDQDGFEQTDMELLAAPVVTVMFTADGAEEAEDVTGDVLSVKKASSGNQFVYTDDGLWQFNLSSRNYTAKGTYLVTVVSGDEAEYLIDPSCVTSFVR